MRNWLIKWFFMSESEEELVQPFTETDMKTRAGIARLIVAGVLLVVSAAFFAFMVLVAVS
ncbi:hypothetical protein C5S30_00205 [ANME-1 cluster archaeon GoMg4]|nr:hypothetical protein [ANME-1 cluster archaeon GoMg4]